MVFELKNYVQQLKLKISGWFFESFKTNHIEYLCYLPGKIGVVASYLLKLFYSGVKLTRDQTQIIEELQKKGLVVIATMHKSYFEFMFYHTRYQEYNLAFPEIGFDFKFYMWQPVSRFIKIIIGFIRFGIQRIQFWKPNNLNDLGPHKPYQSVFIKDQLLDGHSALLSLVEEKGIYRRFVKEKTDPLKYLVEVQQKNSMPIFIVPHLMIYSKKPNRSNQNIFDWIFGTEENPKRIRRLVTLFKNPGRVFVEISEPFNLKKYIEDPVNQGLGAEQMAVILRRRLVANINKHRQSITGPILKSRLEIKQSILINDRLRKFFVELSEKEDRPLKEIYKKADEYLEEIAANYRLSGIQFLDHVVRFLVNNMFEGYTVNLDMLHEIKKISKKGPLVFVPCHKSHIDYLILSYILYHNNMPAPHIAAGKNLSFWPLGPIFRGGGAFFLRRTFKGNKLYGKIFSEYVYKLLEEGFNVEIFIEGGRSRTGKLIRPRQGMLSILLDAFNKGVCEDLIFVPTYIGYDRVIEESSYLHELEGGKKEPESIKNMLGARKFLKKRYGKIYIKFNQPISLKQYIRNNVPNLDMGNSKERFAVCQSLGYRILSSIDKVTVVTPHALVASAILNCSKRRFSHQYIVDQVEMYINLLLHMKANLSDTLLIDPSHAINQVLETYTYQKFIEQLPMGKDSNPSDIIYTVNLAKRPALEYYKNNGLPFFVSAAYTANAILELDAFQFSIGDLEKSYQFLQQFFSNEFAYDSEVNINTYIRTSVAHFVNDAILMPHQTLPDTYNITSEGLRKIQHYGLFLKSYFESYLVVIKYFKSHPQVDMDGKERLKKVQAFGQKLYKRDEIDLNEALSKVTFKNAIDFFIKEGIEGEENIAEIEKYENIIIEFLMQLPS